MAITKVKREPSTGPLTTSDLWAIGVGQVIGAGVVTYTVMALKMTGYSVWLAYLCAIVFGFVIIMPNLLASTAVRIGGGFYSVVSSTLGAKMAGIFAFLFIINNLASAMFATSAAQYFGDIFPALSTPTAKILVAVGLLTLFYVANLLGMDFMAKIQKVMVWILIAALAMFIILGIPRIKLPIFSFRDPGFMPNGMVHFDSGILTGGFLAAVFTLQASTYGYGNIVGYGASAKNPKKDTPKAMLLSALVILVLYVGVAIVAAGVLSYEEYGDSITLVFAARTILPPQLFIVFIIGGPIMALLTTLNASFSYAGLTIAQSCEDGWITKKLAAKNKKGSYWIILTILYLIGAIPLVLGLNINTLLNLTQLLYTILMIIYMVAFIPIPNKFPEAWAKSTWHVSKGFYHAMCVLALLFEVLVAVKSSLSLQPAVFIGSAVGAIICIALGLWRAKTGNITLYDSIWEE